jgi:6-phosphogluconolactonase (cycloisomerase 2 family)
MAHAHDVIITSPERHANVFSVPVDTAATLNDALEPRAFQAELIGNSVAPRFTVTATGEIAALTILYVAGGGASGQVAGYAIDRGSGTLSEIIGSPFPTGGAPSTIGLDPMNRFAYVTNQGSFPSNGDISAYSIDTSTGVLAAVPGSPFQTTQLPQAIAIDSTGRFAYHTFGGVRPDNGVVVGFAINPETGELVPVPGSPFSAGSGPFALTIDPTGRFVFVAHNSPSGSVSGFTIDSATGSLSPIPGSPFAAGDSSSSVVVDPLGRFAYVANQGGSVSAFSIDTATGALTQIPGSPFPAERFAIAITLDPTGQFAYVANHVLGPSTVSAFVVDDVTGALSPVPGSPFQAGEGPRAVTVEPMGQFLYVANGFSGNVSGYSIDSVTGALVPVLGSPFTTLVEPISLAACCR